jgi:integrase
MAHLFKPQIVGYVDADGRRVPKDTPGAKKVSTEARKWYAKGAPLPKGKKVPLASDKRAAQQMLAELERKIERGETPIGGAEVEASRRPLTEHLADFAADLKAKVEPTVHVRKKMSHIRRILAYCGMERLADLDASKVQRFLADLRERGRAVLPLDPAKTTYTRKELAAILGITPAAVASLVARHRLPAAGLGKARRFPAATAEALRERLAQPPGIQTANHYLAAVKSFTRWLVQRRRLASDPLAVLSGSNVKKDLRHDRRTLPLTELMRLLQAAGQSEHVFRGLTGLDRLTLYLTACGTGFRAGELAALVPESFALDAPLPVVSLPAREDKAGRSVTQPLPAGLVAALRDYLADRPAGQPVWPGTWHERAAEMIRADLDAAGIPYAVEGPDGPQYADFHALRHSFVALLDQAGISLKQAMQLARHSDPKLTMARYGRAQMQDLGQAVGRLPELAAAPLELPAPSAPMGPLAEVPPDLSEALAVVGLAVITAGWFVTQLDGSPDHNVN